VTVEAFVALEGRVRFSFTCATCGEDLEATEDGAERDGTRLISVSPCLACCQAAHEEGLAVGAGEDLEEGGVRPADPLDMED
jgi:hypothetical protein